MQGAPGEQPARAGASPMLLAASPAQTLIYPPGALTQHRLCRLRGARRALAWPGWHPLCRNAGHPASPCALHRTHHPHRNTLELTRGLGDEHNPSGALNRSLGRSDAHSPGFGWGRKCPNILCAGRGYPAHKDALSGHHRNTILLAQAAGEGPCALLTANTCTYTLLRK